MRNYLLLVVLLAGLPQFAMAVEHQLETCDQIRTDIGVLPLADPVLLRKLAARKDCGFTSGEVYKAAYGGDLSTFRETPNYRRTEEDDGDHHYREHWRD